jgi:CRP-like cAMP-binding protein
MTFHHLFRDWQDVCEYGAGDVIFSEGDQADRIYVILAGEVELNLHGEVLGIEGEGGLFGETALLGSESRSGAATARTDVRLARLGREQLQQLMSRDSEFALQVMAGLAKRLRSVDAFIGTHIGRKS